ncbi:unnamed protein product [Symbiodinium sp. CCMP2456]|nr:unnamed protein product [Symbiodinium sp. CCMP2456]
MDKMQVQVVGEHNENKNEKNIKKRLAKEFAKSSTPSQALLQMERDEVPVSHRPPAWQIANFRPKPERQSKLAADCVASLQRFVNNPPQDIVVYDGSVITDEEARIMFSFDMASDWLKQQPLSSFLMDFTHKTNAKDLLLGAIGPVGLHTEKDGAGRPAMRFMPMFFLLAHTEDHEAHEQLVRKYVAAATDAKKRDPATGETRLKNQELLPILTDLLQHSSWLPSGIEFTALWKSALLRLREDEAPTDWGEPLLAAYLEANLLQVSPDGSISATWRSGLGCVPPGFTTFAPNSIERSWRLLKSLLKSKFLR